MKFFTHQFVQEAKAVTSGPGSLGFFGLPIQLFSSVRGVDPKLAISKDAQWCVCFVW
jgi:hypothetical protein